MRDKVYIAIIEALRMEIESLSGADIDLDIVRDEAKHAVEYFVQQLQDNGGLSYDR
jgi:hypothetical protein